MTKELVRKRIKMLAKVITAQAMFPVLFVVALQMVSTYLFSLLANAVCARYFPNTSLQIGQYSFNFMYPIMAVLLNALVIPLQLGVAEFLQLLVRGRKPPVSGIFYWFSDGEKLRVAFSYFLFSIVLAFVMLPLSDIPYQYINRVVNEVNVDLYEQIQAGAKYITFNKALFNWPLLGLSALLLILGMLVSVRLVPHLYILVDRPQEGAFLAAKRSWEAMRGHTWEYLVFLLSFAGWYFACIATFFIAGIYLSPYLQISTVIFVGYVQSHPIFQQDIKTSAGNGGEGGL